jgi:hypothetical protein
MPKRATLEILDPDEKIFGSNTIGKYFVQEFEDDQPRGGQFFKTIKEAEKHMVEYEAGDETDTKVLLQEDG